MPQRQALRLRIPDTMKNGDPKVAAFQCLKRQHSNLEFITPPPLTKHRKLKIKITAEVKRQKTS